MSSARAPPGSLLAAGAGQAHSLLSQASSTRARDARAAVTGAVRGRHHGPHYQEDEAETDHARGARRRGVGHVRRRGAHEQRGQISASRGAAVPSRHRRDSCPSDEVVGGFFFDFEAIRTESSDRDAPRRHVVFGKVLDAVSMMVVHKIEAVQAGSDNKPKLPVLISQCGEL